MYVSKYIKVLLITLLVFLPFCEEDSGESGSSGSDTWLISQSEVQDGGPGKDGIAAISDPEFIPVSEANFLKGNDLVIGIQIGNFIRAFPHPILDHHEIVNHEVESTSFALTYCPLTGSAIAWDTSDIGINRTFGVSGLLYNSNLIPYDRATDSNWSQMLNLCVNGSLVGQKSKAIMVVETEWTTWQQLYPQSMILSTNTGFDRNYNIYPYGDYRRSDDLIFPVGNEDNRLHKKERVHGILVQEGSKVYPINWFSTSIEVINDIFNDLEIVVAGSSRQNFAVSFERMLSDGTSLTFQSVLNEFPVIMMDNEGTKWDIFGNGVSGPRQGTKLTPTQSFISYWFAWAAFYPEAQIHSLSSQSDLLAQSRGEFSFLRTDDSFLHIQLEESKFMRRMFFGWPHVLRETQLLPDYSSGVRRGFRMGNISEKSYLAELGFKNDDVILSVNGFALNSKKALLHLLGWIKEEKRYDVFLERNGKLLRRIYTLQ